nr:putative mitochondrial chaperone bcs1-a [Quercus suber]
MTSWIGLSGLRSLSKAISGSTGKEVSRKLVRHVSQRSLSFAICIPWIMLGTHLWQSGLLKTVFDTLRNLCSFRIVARVNITADHYLYDVLLDHLAEKELVKRARNLTLRKRVDGQDDHRTTDLPSKMLAPLQYIPDTGKYPITFEGQPMTVERRRWQTSSYHSRDRGLTISRKGVITISYKSFSGTTEPIKAFLNSLRTKSSQKTSSKIWEARRNANKTIRWQNTAYRPRRSMETVLVERHLRESIVQAITTHLLPHERKYRANREVSERLTMLFHGPQGTGKTDLCIALAAHFGFDIYIISFADEISDQELATLSETASGRKCILVLEHVEKCGQDRNPVSRRLSNTSTSDETADPPRMLPTTSGLLSVVEGFHSQQDRIVILTTDDRSALDPELLNPGRIHHHFHFDYASTAMMTRIFQTTFTRSPAEFAESDRDEKTPVSIREHIIARLAAEFSFQLPSRALTTAEIQRFLASHRATPHRAVRAALQHFEPIARARGYGMHVPLGNSPPMRHEGEKAAADRDEEESMRMHEAETRFFAREEEIE